MSLIDDVINRARQQAADAAARKAEAERQGRISDAMPHVNEQFQTVLGRAPTQAELDYINKFIGEGGIQPYEVGQMLQSMPEYQSKLLDQNVNKFDKLLSANDEQRLTRGADIAGSVAQSRFAGLGRPNTSALAASVFGATGQMSADLASQRQSALAQFYGNGLNTNQGIAQMQGTGAMERAYGLRDETRQRQYQVDDRNYMKDVYDQYLKQQQGAQKAGAFGNVFGTVAGAGLGGYFGGPKGAYYGAQAGGAFGQNAGGLFR